MSTEMNDIIQRYWSGETTQDEEQRLQAYMVSGEVADEHLDMVELFSFYADQKTMTLPGELEMEAIYSSTLSPMDALVEKYLDAATSLDEEAQLRAYLTSDKVADSHRDLIPMFEAFGAEHDTQFDGDLTELERLQIQWSQKPKVRYMFPKVVGVAATLALLMMIAFNFLQEDTSSYKGKYTELQDPEEALALTKDALAFLGKKYDKGTASMKYIKELEKTNVFNFKN